MLDHGNWQKGEVWIAFEKVMLELFTIYNVAVPENIKFQECRNSCIRLDCMLKEIQGERIKLFYEVRLKRLTKTDSDYLVAL